MKKLGIEMDKVKKEMLGMKWREMLSALSQQKEAEEGNPPMTGLEELQKVKGFPIVTEGKFYLIRPKSEMAQEEEETDVTDVKGMFGGFAKKMMKKKKKEEKDNFSFRFRTEIVKYE